MCFSPHDDPQSVSAMFQLADGLSKVKNFPIINDVLAQVAICRFIIMWCYHVHRFEMKLGGTVIENCSRSQARYFLTRVQVNSAFHRFNADKLNTEFDWHCNVNGVPFVR